MNISPEAWPQGTKEQREQRSQSTAYIPYTYYECIIPDYFPSVPLHWHSEFEINYILSGSGDFRCGNSSITAQAGDIIIILPGILHSIYPNGSKRLSYDTIVFHPAMLYGRGDDRCYAECLYPLSTAENIIDLPISKGNALYRELGPSVATIMSCARENSGISDLLLKSELMRMFWAIISNHGLRSTSPKEISLAESIKPAIEYIRENYEKPITIDTLAGKTHLSKSYFMARFKKATGVSAIEYINQIRIRAACELLISSDISSAGAALEVGFRNLSNFNHHFRKQVGCAPREYRNLAAKR